MLKKRCTHDSDPLFRLPPHQHPVLKDLSCSHPPLRRCVSTGSATDWHSVLLLKDTSAQHMFSVGSLAPRPSTWRTPSLSTLNQTAGTQSLQQQAVIHTHSEWPVGTLVFLYLSSGFYSSGSAEWSPKVKRQKEPQNLPRLHEKSSSLVSKICI